MKCCPDQVPSVILEQIIYNEMSVFNKSADLQQLCIGPSLSNETATPVSVSVKPALKETCTKDIPHGFCCCTLAQCTLNPRVPQVGENWAESKNCSFFPIENDGARALNVLA